MGAKREASTPEKCLSPVPSSCSSTFSTSAPLSPGAPVLLAGLSKSDLNGKKGVVQSFNPQTDRWNVELAGTGRVIAARAECLPLLRDDGVLPVAQAVLLYNLPPRHWPQWR